MKKDHSRTIVVFGMDNFSRKQIYPFRLLARHGYRFDVFTNDQVGGSHENVNALEDSSSCYILKKDALARFLQIFSYLFVQRKNIAHAEIYPGGRYAFIYLILSKLFGLKTIAVEWGTLIDWDILPGLTKFSMRVCYRYADIVWYRELYMKKMIERFGSRSSVFIHNAVPASPQTNNDIGKEYTFLWVNRLIRHRFSDWFVDILAEEKFARTKNALLGLRWGLNDPSIDEVQDYVISKKLKNLQLYDFIDPRPFYLNAKFFVLPASIVFCNNSLLEAMACGAVPIITDVEGSRMIVDDGLDGFVAKNTKEGFREAMNRAMRLSPEEYANMSNGAVRKVARRFSFEERTKKILDLYLNLEKSRKGRLN